MNILFVNSNLYGHINPTLGLVRKLIERGNKVSYYCSWEFSSQIKEIGADWINFSDELGQFLKKYKPTDRHPFYMLMEYMLQYDEAVLPHILELIRNGQYDMVICDSIFGGGCFLKQLVDIPVVVSHSSFAMSRAPIPSRMFELGFHPQLHNCYRILWRLCEAYAIEEPSLEQVFTSRGERNLVYTTRSFNGDEGIKEPEYIFVGPSVERAQACNDIDLSVIGNRKLVYISLGSINTDYPEFYKDCINAFRDPDYYVCMSVGRKTDISQLGVIPDNFLVRNYLPQLDILKCADVFITHAGFNSVNEALFNGVPMLALPQVNDQHKVAKHIESMKLGLSEDIKELTVTTIQSDVSTLINEPEFRENCIRMSGEMKRHTELEQSAVKLEDYYKEWKGK